MVMQPALVVALRNVALMVHGRVLWMMELLSVTAFIQIAHSAVLVMSSVAIPIKNLGRMGIQPVHMVLNAVTLVNGLVQILTAALLVVALLHQ
jgi:hypothetical protein